MNIKENNEMVRSECMTLTNQFGDSLKIYYENDKLFFEAKKSNPDSAYYITRRDELVYMGFKKLFLNLRKNDRLQLLPVGKIGSVFEWVGEGNGVPEVQDRLVVEERDNFFRISLDKNKFNHGENMTVGFSLTDSKYPEIVKILDDTFISTLGYPYIFKKRTKVKGNSHLK